MTTPSTVPTDGLADATSASVSIVGGALVDSLVATARALFWPVAGAAVLVALVLAFVVFSRVRFELHAARTQTDPRPRVNPSLSDVLGEW